MNATVIRAGQSVGGEPIRFIGKEMFVKPAGGSNAGSMSVMEDVTPAGGGPPLHSHGFEEWFWVLEGSYDFEAAGEITRVEVGDFVHVGSEVPHTYQVVSQMPGRLLVVMRPGGVETYFAELATQMMQDAHDVAALGAIGTRYGVKVLGPPLAARR